MSLELEMVEITKVFFDECREGLNIMESGLLNLDASADLENINTIFRAAHSIKGGAGTFGFPEVAGFTHGVETLLDEMRNGKRAVTDEAIQILLKSCDCLCAMMAAIEDGKPIDQPRVAACNLDLEEILRSQSKAPTPPAAPLEPPVAAAASAGAAATSVNSTASDVEGGWLIRFEPVTDLLKLRNEPTRIFAELEKLGELKVRADLSALPPFADIDPELCYLAWDLEIRGAVARKALDEVFDWVDPACGLEFTTIGISDDTTSQAVPEAAPPVVRPTAAPSVPDQRVPSTGTAAAAPKSGADSSSIRVSTEKVDNIINLVGELVITQSMLGRFADGIGPGELDSLRQGLSQLARNMRELQECVMQVRMLPISFAFNRFPRLVHDLTHKLGKKVDLRLSGENTELDKTVLEKMSDPLVHLVRNALDHGLETPERRLAAGKGETGTLELAAFHEGGNIIIEVRDDGAGLNKAKILSKARERGLVAPELELSDDQIHNLIFLPGFSTADQVSDVSGRGVGMDVVRRNINDLGGNVQLSSQEGKGSVIRIRLPLTLAILDGQLVRVGQETYVISLLAIVETVQVNREGLNTLAGQTELFRLRNAYLPVVKLCDLFGVVPDSRNSEDGLLVVVEADGARVGLLVDDLLAQQQVVIKSLETNFAPVAGLAGATILGDGKVALILDVPGLIARASREKQLTSITRVA
jgi:two-component system chemotaxis sensor kinase CheA